MGFKLICVTVAFRTVCPRTIVSHTSVFHRSDDVCIFFDPPILQPTKNLACFSLLILLRRRTRSKNQTTLLDALCPVRDNTTTPHSLNVFAFASCSSHVTGFHETVVFVFSSLFETDQFVQSSGQVILI